MLLHGRAKVNCQQRRNERYVRRNTAASLSGAEAPGAGAIAPRCKPTAHRAVLGTPVRARHFVGYRHCVRRHVNQMMVLNQNACREN